MLKYQIYPRDLLGKDIVIVINIFRGYLTADNMTLKQNVVTVRL